MFYLSRGEQTALIVLTALLLAGAGMVVHAKGRHAAEAGVSQPLFVSAPAQPVPADQGGETPAKVAAPTPTPPGAGAVIVPRTSPPPRRRAAAKAGLICINTATVEELDRLPGIGPVYAGRIVAYREQREREGRSGFEAKDELLNVPGIGPKRYAAIRDLVTL
jgi:competence ComEA-like helix-hairpin-helix protein